MIDNYKKGDLVWIRNVKEQYSGNQGRRLWTGMKYTYQGLSREAMASIGLTGEIYHIHSAPEEGLYDDGLRYYCVQVEYRKGCWAKLACDDDDLEVVY
jgi:hypothetical protein